MTAAPFSSKLPLEWIWRSSRILIKKLSRNDCDWADNPSKHQNGFYIPREVRESQFFPTLKNFNPKKPHIFESPLKTFWPAAGEIKDSNLKHYSNKGSEMHLTGVPKSEFEGLSPVSLVLVGKLRESKNEFLYWLMTVDSSSEEAEKIESLFDLNVDFHFGLFDPDDILKLEETETDKLIGELIFAIKNNSIDDFINSALIPDPQVFAHEAQNIFLTKNGMRSLDPYSVESPGDVVMRISRDIEFDLFKKAERRLRAAEVLRTLSTEGGISGGDSLVAAVVKGFPALNKVFLSAQQTRKSRAGCSFELHLARVLSDGNIPFEPQSVFEGRRPDFVLPNLARLKQRDRDFYEALILSAKTTLRERWKQVSMEKFDCGLFLATVDDRVSAASIDSMSAKGICLVVPESLKKSTETRYTDKANVITFRDFFDDEVATRRQKFWEQRDVQA